MKPIEDPRIVGPITEYINALKVSDPDECKALLDDIRSMLESREGVKFLELLDNAVLRRCLPVEVSERALCAHNGARILAHEILGRLRNAAVPTEDALAADRPRRRR